MVEAGHAVLFRATAAVARTRTLGGSVIASGLYTAPAAPGRCHVVVDAPTSARPRSPRHALPRPDLPRGAGLDEELPPIERFQGSDRRR
jgi:hypothetical protein